MSSATRLESDLGSHPRPERAAPCVPDHELVRPIGRGSYGEVWLARNALGGWRAVKFIRREDFDEARPLEREFEGIRRYEPVSRAHDGLTQVLHAGWGGDGAYFFYVMELADDAAEAAGTDFADYRPRTLRSDLAVRGALPVGECIAVGLALAQALAHLHRHGLVHRDLKPSNIIFVNGRAKLADIGLVGLAGDARTLVGTEGFVPREGSGSPQADVFGLGKVLYEIATGKDRHDFPAIPAAWAREPLALEFNEVLLRACENDPERRYASAHEMAADLAQLQAGRSLRRAHTIERRLRWMLRCGGLLVLGAFVALGGWTVARWEREREHGFRLRAERAEVAALLAQAQASVHSGRGGQRYDALDAVRRAQLLGGDTLALRNAAVAALCLADLHPAWRRPLPGRIPDQAGIDAAGERYAVVDATGEVIVRRVADGHEIQRFRLPVPAGTTPETAFADVEFTTQFSGKYLGIRGKDPIMRVWDLETGRLAWEASATDFSASSSGSILVLTSPQGNIEVRDLPTGRVLREFPSHGELAVTDSGGRRALTQRSGELQVLDLASGAIVHSWPASAEILTFAWHPSGRLAATAANDHTLSIWNVETGEAVRTFHGHDAEIASLEFHPTDDVLVSTGWDGLMRWWDFTGRSLGTLPDSGVDLRFNAEGSRLTFLSYNGELTVCESTPTRALRELNAPPPSQHPYCNSIALSPDARWLAVAGEDGVFFWDWNTRWLLPTTLPAETNVVRFTDGGRKLLTCGAGGCEWRALQQTPAFAMDPPHQLAPASRFSGAAHAPGLTAVGQPGGIRLLDEKGADRWLAGGDTDYRMVALSADGLHLAGGAWKTHAVWLWQVADGSVRKFDLETHADVSFSPDSRFFATGSAGEFALRDPATGAVLRRFPRRDTANQPARAVWSPDGRLLVLLETRRRLRFLDTATFEERFAIEWPFNGVFEFSPDSRHLLGAGDGNRVATLDLAELRRGLAALGLDWRDAP